MYFICFSTEFESYLSLSRNKPFLSAYTSDIGGFVTVVVVVTKNYLRKLHIKLVIHRGGIHKSAGTSSTTCSGTICKEGELGLCGITARLDILVISKMSPEAGSVFCDKTKRGRGGQN